MIRTGVIFSYIKNSWIAWDSKGPVTKNKRQGGRGRGGGRGKKKRKTLLVVVLYTYNQPKEPEAGGLL